MKITFEHYFKKTELGLTDFEIKSSENNLGFNIPLQLRNCYLFSNGGGFIKSHLPSICGTDEGDGVWGIFDLDTMVSTFRTAESNLNIFGEVLELSDKLFPFTISHYGKKLC